MAISRMKVGLRRKAGFPGSAYEAQAEELDFTAADPQVAQVSTVAVGGTFAVGDEITITLNDVDAVYEVTDGDLATIADDLANALNSHPGANTYTISESDGADTVTITGHGPGVAFTLLGSSSGAGTVTATETIAAVEADEIPFGRLVIRGSKSVVSPYPNRLGKLPDDGEIDDDAALCISLRKYDEPGDSYAPNSRCAGMKRGAIVVQIEAGAGGDIEDGDEVFAGSEAGERGSFFTAAGAGRVALSKSIATFRKYLGDDLAVIDCSFH